MQIPMALSFIDGKYILQAEKLLQAAIDTLLMVCASLPLTIAMGLPIGLVLYMSRCSLLQMHPAALLLIRVTVDLLRSVPFILLMIALIPVTLFLVGTSLGVRGAILPLVIGAAPFYARLVEASLRDVDYGVVEASVAMGATPWQLIWNVLLPESRTGLISAATVTAITLVGFTAMGGAIGSGGLGDIAYREGYLRSNWDFALVTVGVLLVIVFVIQWIGDRLVAHYTRR